MTKASIELYNKLIPFMDSIEDNDGYVADGFASKEEGLGFYIELGKKNYIEVHIWDETDISVTWNIRGGRCWHDVLNDRKVQMVSCHNMDEVEKAVRNIMLNYRDKMDTDVIDRVARFAGLNEKESKDLRVNVEIVKAFIQELRNGDSDVTGETSEVMIKELVDYLVD